MENRLSFTNLTTICAAGRGTWEMPGPGEDCLRGQGELRGT